jgi:hypothetical protein
MLAGREAAAEEAELRREEQRLAALAVQESKRRQMAAGSPVACFTRAKVQILMQRGLAAENFGHCKWRQRFFFQCFFPFGGAHSTLLSLLIYFCFYDCVEYCRKARGTASGAGDGGQGAFNFLALSVRLLVQPYKY